ncbi:MAG: adenylate/guanylate cyclase domain-containing protein [Syntrophorhabdus sp.]
MASLCICITIMLVRNAGLLQSIELVLYDFYLATHNFSSPKPDDRVVLVRITENDIKELGHWPLNDGEIAALLTSIEKAGPRVIGLDLFRDIPVPPGKKDLEKVFAEGLNIIGICKIGDDLRSGITGPYAAHNAEGVGFNDLVIDHDGTIRRGLLFVDDGKEVFRSFSLLMALEYLKKSNIIPEPDTEDPTHMRLGRALFLPLRTNDGGYVGADTRGYQYLVDFENPTFTSYTISEVMRGLVPSKAFRDRIVLVGSSAERLKDVFQTPLNRFRSSHEFEYGVELHAMMAGQLIRLALGESRPLQFFSETYEWLWVIMWGLLGGIFAHFAHRLWQFVACVAGIAGIVFAGSFLAFIDDWWIPVIPAIMSYLACTGFTTAYISAMERSERESLMRLFSQHVSRDVAKEIWKNRDKFMDGGRPSSRKFTVTILFTDLKGFTTISEKLEPQVLIDWLNEYMEVMGKTIIKYGGTINKYIGDSIMAIFGAPIPRQHYSQITEDAISAVRCALEMGSETERLNEIFEGRNYPRAFTRMGIYTGPIVAGCLGSSERMEYTVIGDTVNIASRLEGFGKNVIAEDDRPYRVMIGEATFNCLEGRFVTVNVGSVALKGKEDRVNVYQVIPGKNETIQQ